ncbi:uncharacterized protein L201_007956 [Kwoniella dendrophila CBS 6074]|uniref:F-box domain-containing protein n=1 Tax=Kwoniella dendrophila CBS 6074 TaxID=1295534 RepID=A0AAX4K5Z8_9TREE
MGCSSSTQESVLNNNVNPAYERRFSKQLPSDIIISIAYHCSGSTLKILAILDKSTHLLIIPILYNSIKINSSKSLIDFSQNVPIPYMKLVKSLELVIRHDYIPKFELDTQMRNIFPTNEPIDDDDDEDFSTSTNNSDDLFLQSNSSFVKQTREIQCKHDHGILKNLEYLTLEIIGKKRPSISEYSDSMEHYHHSVMAEQDENRLSEITSHWLKILCPSIRGPKEFRLIYEAVSDDRYRYRNKHFLGFVDDDDDDDDDGDDDDDDEEEENYDDSEDFRLLDKIIPTSTMMKMFEFISPNTNLQSIDLPTCYFSRFRHDHLLLPLQSTRLEYIVLHLTSSELENQGYFIDWLKGIISNTNDEKQKAAELTRFKKDDTKKHKLKIELVTKRTPNQIIQDQVTKNLEASGKSTQSFDLYFKGDPINR